MKYRHFLLLLAIITQAKAGELATAASLLKSWTSRKIVTPTRTYLKQPELSGMVQEKWGRDVEVHKPMIDRMMEKEEEFAKTHHVFYHAQRSHLVTYQHVITKLYEYVHNKKVGNFTFVRKWHTALEKTDVEKFVTSRGCWHYDRDRRLRPFLLSANVSLFGNTSRSRQKECSFDYFVSHYNMSPPQAEAMFSDLAAEFGFSPASMEQLLSLTESNDSSGMLQIFIPKELANKCVYIASPVGYPLCFQEQGKDEKALTPANVLEASHL